MPKKILYIEHGLKPYGGGHEAMLIVYRNLHRDVFEPHLYSLESSQFAQRAGEDGVKLHIHPMRNHFLGAEIGEIYRTLKAVPFIIEAMAYIIRLYRFVSRGGFDILHPCDNLSIIAALFIGRLLGIPVVFYVKDDYSRGYHKYLVGLYVRYASYIIPISRSTGEPFFRRSPEKTRVIYEGFELEKYNRDKMKSSFREEFSIDEGVFCIAMIAVLKERKGHIYLFKAVRKLIDSGITDIRCLIVGEGETGVQLRAFVIENNLANHIIFTGFRKDPWNFIVGSDITVLPSISEGLPRVCMESLALKTICVGSRVSGMPEIIIDQNTGFLFEQGDIDGLSDIIRKIYDNRTGFNEIRENGYAHLRNTFSIERCVSRLEEIYREVGNIS